MSLNSYVIIEYIKSSVDIILNLKFEEIEKRLMDKNNSSTMHPDSEQPQRKSQAHVRERNQRDRLGPEGKGLDDQCVETLISNTDRSSMSQVEGPPKVYEELIQSLEADIRKHIRVCSYS